jgi:16S rRNA (cytidine1402-2'-O)-methyltransferase
MVPSTSSGQALGEAAGVVVLAATPIGDPDDATPGLRRELAAADVIAAEDTRRLRRLLDQLNVSPHARVVSYFEGNEARRTAELLAALQSGARVVVVTDAGMPSVSDPGYRLVVAAAEHGIRVTAVPGPSAVLTALAVSGLPVDRFCFEGFLSRKGGERHRRLTELATERRTMVFFEAARRTAETLEEMAEVFGPGRRAAVCRELSKTYEEIRRGPLADLQQWAADGLRGEVTLVVAGAEVITADLPAAVAEVRQQLAEGSRLRPAVAAVAGATGLKKNALYDAVVRSGLPGLRS